MNRAFKSLVVLFLIAVIQLPSFAGFWSKRSTPAKINVNEKIQYVNPVFWDNFSDPYLKCYILKAVEDNHNARQASWMVEEYRQAVKYSFGQELPRLSAGGSYIGAHWPEHIRGVPNNIFAVPILASYEADIFLKNKDKTKSKKKEYQATRFDEKAIYIALATDVATAYINVLQFDKLVALQEEIVKTRKEKLKRENNRFNQGVTSVENLNDVQKDFESAKNALSEFKKSQTAALTQFAVLIGESPENISQIKRGALDGFEYLGAIPDEVSSDIIFSRPDIMAIEARLQKANIDIRVARKEFLPKLNINGFYIFSNVGAGSFGSWESTIAAILANATIDLFKGGQKFANLRIFKTKYEQMFEEYRQTDLVALKEVNDSLYILKKDFEIDINTQKKMNLQADNFKRAVYKRNQGVISDPDLMNQHELFVASRQDKVTSKTAKMVDIFTLYKAVGGKI